MDSILDHGQTQFLEHVYFFRSLVQIFKNIFSDPEFWRTLYIDKFSPWNEICFLSKAAIILTIEIQWVWIRVQCTGSDPISLSSALSVSRHSHPEQIESACLWKWSGRGKWTVRLWIVQVCVHFSWLLLELQIPRSCDNPFCDSTSCQFIMPKMLLSSILTFVPALLIFCLVVVLRYTWFSFLKRYFRILEIE